jgi:hypothetical protein
MGKLPQEKEIIGKTTEKHFETTTSASSRFFPSAVAERSKALAHRRKAVSRGTHERPDPPCRGSERMAIWRGWYSAPF